MEKNGMLPDIQSCLKWAGTNIHECMCQIVKSDWTCQCPHKLH